MLKSMLVGFLVAVLAVFAVVGPVEAQGPGSLSSEEQSAFASLERRAGRVLLEGGPVYVGSADAFESLAEAFELLADEFDRAFSAHRQAEERRDAPLGDLSASLGVDTTEVNGVEPTGHQARSENAYQQYARMLLGTSTGADAYRAAGYGLVVMRASERANVTVEIPSCRLDECINYTYNSCRELVSARKRVSG